MKEELTGPHLVLVLDSKGKVVLNAVTDDARIKVDWGDPQVVWYNFNDWIENPLGHTFQRVNPSVNISFMWVRSGQQGEPT